MKTLFPKAAALALVAGVAGIALIGTSSDGHALYMPNFACNPDFKKVGNLYLCEKIFARICAKGTDPGTPVLTHLGGNKWKVSYSCGPVVH